MLTGIRDLDYKILNKLGDKDLVNICLVNKEASKLCDDQIFWLNRILTKFPKVPSEVFIKNKDGRSWSEYYIKDLRKTNLKNPNEVLSDGAEKGREDWVMIALSEGADVHAVNDYALRYAASFNGHTETVKVLLEAGADPHAQNDNALRWARQIGHSEVVKLLKQYM